MPMWPSWSTANHVASMLCAAGKSTWHGRFSFIGTSTERYAEIRERRRERRIGQRFQRAALAGVGTPRHGLVPGDRAKARTLAAGHKTAHGLERPAAGNLSNLGGAGRVLSAHWQ